MEFEARRKTPLNPFSPWKSAPGSLQRTLVGRDHTVKDILEKTRLFCSDAPPKHCLLVGRRGLGKTHLLSLIYHFYEKNCTQQGYETISNCVLPVLLLEEEFNRKKKHLKGKVAAIAKLTGVNPRLMVFLYDIVTKKMSLKWKLPLMS